ncbi:MAG: ImuA family protein [Rubricella sp.]
MSEIVPFPIPSSAAALPIARDKPSLAEVLAETPQDAGGIGFVLGSIARDKPLLWVQDRMSARESGEPYLPGLGGREILRARLGQVRDVLQALEDGLSCTGLGGVIGEIWGDPPALDFTATKRLALRAEAGGLPCWVIRRAAVPNLSAARHRLRIASLPSAPHPDDPRAPGDPRWRVEVFRARGAPPGTWIVTHDRAADRLDMAAESAAGTVDEDRRGARLSS